MEKTATTVISSATISAGETTALSSCTAIDLSRATQLILTVKGTFNASSTDGMTVYYYASTDNSTYSDYYWDSAEIQNCRQVGFTSANKEFMVDETITAAAGGTGTVTGWVLSSGSWAANDAAGTLYLQGISGSFTDTQSLTGGSSGCSATQNGSIAAHSIVRTLYPTAVCPLYLKARIQNNDSSYSITSASLISTVQTL